MIVMLANNTGIQVGYLAGRFPGRVGHLYSPGDQRGPFPFMPCGLDNGAFKPSGFNEEKWLALLEWSKLRQANPRWVLVPDAVTDRDGTLERWRKYAPIAAGYGWPLAFAVQDGMTVSDVPPDAQVVFVGGSTEWKWFTYQDWCRAFPRVHIGRVNSYRHLMKCHDAGAESTDGTGFTRGDQKQARDLMAYLSEASGEAIRVRQEPLFGGNNAVRVSGILD